LIYKIFKSKYIKFLKEGHGRKVDNGYKLDLITLYSFGFEYSPVWSSL